MSEYLLCKDLLAQLVQRGGTDLLLSPGQPPKARIDKNLVSLGMQKLLPADTKALTDQIMDEGQKKRFEEDFEIDFSFGIPNVSRFRANIFKQRGSVSAAFRSIPYRIKSFEDLNLPAIVNDMCEKPNGLVLVTGPTGSGKSTTLAAMIDRINSSRASHIITIEDPIEYLHTHKNCTVDQREVYSDTKSFARALRSILRQDPDVVLLGEMRDAESIQAALTIAETGHLCFATLHTNSCSQTLARIVDVFSGDKQQQVRTQLAMALNCVMTQILLPRIGGGLQLGIEIMVVTSAIKSMIREQKIHNIDNQIQLGSKYGMQTMNQSLTELIRTGKVSETDALMASPDRDDLRKIITR
jgi:twitching motility protein PilT